VVSVIYWHFKPIFWKITTGDSVLYIADSDSGLGNAPSPEREKTIFSHVLRTEN